MMVLFAKSRGLEMDQIRRTVVRRKEGKVLKADIRGRETATNDSC